MNTESPQHPVRNWKHGDGGSAILVHSGINNRMVRAAVLGLHVEDLLTDFDVRIEPRTHRRPYPLLTIHSSETRNCDIIESSFDRVRSDVIIAAQLK